jgi:hypothetical protein
MPTRSTTPAAPALALALALLIALGMPPAPAAAQAPAGFPEISAASRQAIKAYTLTPARADAITRTLSALTADAMKSPESLKVVMARAGLSLEAQAADMARDPATAAILKANGLSAQEYTTGLLAMRAAKFAGAPSPLAGLENAANVAFLKANPAIAQRFQQAEMGQ